MTEDVLALSVLAVVTYFAATLQALTGLAFALIMMPAAALLLGMRTAAPLVALTALTLYVVNVCRYRESLNLQEIWRLAAAAACGVPVGVWAFKYASTSVLQAVLGAILFGYGLHGLARPLPPRACSTRWAYLAGFLAGGLGGAFNTPGPPLAVYGGLRQWPKEEFRAGLQTLFVISATLTVIAHVVARHLSAAVLWLYAWSLLALVLGVLTGAWIDRFVDKQRFRRLVLLLILFLGLSLLANLARR